MKIEERPPITYIEYKVQSFIASLAESAWKSFRETIQDHAQQSNQTHKISREKQYERSVRRLNQAFKNKV